MPHYDRLSTKRSSLIVSIMIAIMVAGPLACAKKKKRSGSANGANGPTTEDPTVPDPVPDVGVDEPPITNDGITTVDTTNSAKLSHLIFENTATQEAGRHLSEFLVVVRAREASCIRLKTRPTDGLQQEVDDDVLSDIAKGEGACAGQKVLGEQKPEEEEGKEDGQDGADSDDGGTTESGEDEEGGSDTQDDTDASKSSLRLSGQEALLEYPTNGKLEASNSLALASQSAAVCSPRLFRMEADGMAPVVSKTGRLLHVGKRTRIWLDDEFANVCTGGIGLDDRSPTPYAALIQNTAGFNSSTADKLWLAQLQRLASEMDVILGKMTTTYGRVSDIDSSGYVEIFLSPDINRKYFIPIESSLRDHFRADLVYRPQDLALYNPETNPISNEGEILYLWVPDPAGIYNGVQYPSSNSLTTNYAKGYLAAQAMTLIIANQRLFVQKRTQMEERWLVESLAMLGASYYAGNDFPVRSLAQFLTSRPQYLSLTQGVDTSLVSPAYQAMASDEVVGERTLFGWYLHSRLCGESVAPCDKIRSLIDSQANGTATVEGVLAESMDKTLENFALSVAVELLEKPDVARAYWQQNPPLAGLPPAPIKMPALTQIFESDPPKTEEITYTGSLLNGDPIDRTVAGPFPNKESIFYQPLSADNDMEFKLATNSIAVIKVTSLIEQKTDITAFFGKGLNVVFVPAGERDTSLRRIHIEKVSEEAHMDLRPVNLTSVTDYDTTYAYPPTYDSLDYSVTPTRKLWILGAIDNYSLNVQGAEQTTGDSDAYAIAIKPCEGLAEPELTACQAQQSHQVLVQVVIRDFEKELEPMLVVTDPDRSIFRGFSVLGRLSDIAPDVKEDDNTRLRLCTSQLASPALSATFSNGTPGVVTAANHGLSNDDLVQFSAGSEDLPTGITPRINYTVVYVNGNTFTLEDSSGNAVTISGATADVHNLHTGSPSTCANGGIAGNAVFNHEVSKLDPQGYVHTYDNFLMLGLLGFPYTNIGSIFFNKMPDCDGYRCMKTYEWQHSYYNFKLDKDLAAKTYSFYSAPAVPPADSVQVTGEALDTLYSVKSRIDDCATFPDDQSDEFVDECKSIEGLTEALCRKVCTNAATIDAFMKNELDNNNAILVCPPGADCFRQEYLISAGTTSSAWIDPSRYYWYQLTDSIFATYYNGIEPVGTSGYCAGEPGNYTTDPRSSCELREDAIYDSSDIRQQLNVTTSELSLSSDCRGRILGPGGYKVCIDSVSSTREFEPDEPYVFWFAGQKQDTDRNRQGYPGEDLPFEITFRAGEVLNKPERVQSVLVSVPPAGKVINVMVGGRNLSQGKYLLRVQLSDFD